MAPKAPKAAKASKTPKASKAPSPVKRSSRRLRSEEPEELGSSTHISPFRAARVIKKKSQALSDAAFNLAAIVVRVLSGDRDDRFNIIKPLTISQRKAVIESITARNNDLESRLQAMTRERDEALAAATAVQTREQAGGATSAAVASSSPSPASPSSSASNQLAIIPEAALVTPAPIYTSPEASATPAPITTSSAASATPYVPRWRQLVGSAAGIFSSPFARKRSAPTEPAEEPMTVKRARTESPASSGQQTKRQRPTSATTTPAKITPAKTPSRFLLPSARNPNVPTSLSAVSERTERTEEEITPIALAYTPSVRRTIASVRAARRTSATPNTMISTPHPARSNADERFAKLDRKRQLEAELEKMKKDTDIIEMESHRRKRVKVDQLAYIPHNRPGDADGTFRVPDIDSDDEMEVDISVPERTNIFAEAAQQEHVQEHAEAYAQTPTPAPVQPLVQQVAPVQTQAHEEEVEEEEEGPIVFNFPSFGKRGPEHGVSEAYSNECGDIFTAGFQQWRQTNRLSPR